MSFVCKQVSADRWGIYSGTRLLATVNDQETCKAIMDNFESGRTKVPTVRQLSADDASQSTPGLSVNLTDTATSTPAAQTSSAQSEQTVPVVAKASTVGESSGAVVTMSDDDLAKILDVESLKVNELESAVLRAQRGQKE